MDRELHAHRSNGTLCAAFRFNYDNRNSGLVRITTYGYEEHSGHFSIYPLLKYEIPFSHKEMQNQDELKTFDLALASEEIKQHHTDVNPDEVTFEYDPAEKHMRYLMGHFHGIIDIVFDYTANEKALYFVSAESVKADEYITTNCMENNYELIKRFQETCGHDGEIRLVSGSALQKENEQDNDDQDISQE